jgi:hypothetical protein
MRGRLRASATTFALAVALSACRNEAARPPRPAEPPPRIVVASFEHVALRVDAWTSLHALLAARARSGATDHDGDLNDAARAYAKVRDDEDDAELARTTHALASCADDACARRALAGTPWEQPFGEALAPFAARGWGDALERTFRVVDEIRSAFGPEGEAIAVRAMHDLAIPVDAAPVTVPVVLAAPSPRGNALLPIALAARSGCFVGEKDETERMQTTRINDCVVTRAMIAYAPRSGVFRALARRLPPAEAERAYTLVAVHAVAAIALAWSPKHLAVHRMSAAAASPKEMAWLAKNWDAPADVDAFTERFVEALR